MLEIVYQVCQLDIEAIYSMAVLKKNGHEVIYSKNLPDNLKDIDLFIIISSIVCCETEIKKIKEILLVNKKILVIGPFATLNNAGASVISGEPEFYFLQNTIDFIKFMICLIQSYYKSKNKYIVL